MCVVTKGLLECDTTQLNLCFLSVRARFASDGGVQRCDDALTPLWGLIVTMATEASSDARGAGDWRHAVDPASGKSFWWNIHTQETSWHDPSLRRRSAQHVAAATFLRRKSNPKPAGDGRTRHREWNTAIAPDGRTYYWNRTTGERSWTNPSLKEGRALGTRAQRAKATAAKLKKAKRQGRSTTSHTNAAGAAKQDAGTVATATSSASGHTGVAPSAQRSGAAPTSDTTHLDWKRHTSDSGRVFYFNARTGESSWEPPAAPKQAAPAKHSQATGHGAQPTKTTTRVVATTETHHSGQGGPASGSGAPEVAVVEWCEATARDGRVYEYNARGERRWKVEADAVGKSGAASAIVGEQAVTASTSADPAAPPKPTAVALTTAESSPCEDQTGWKQVVPVEGQPYYYHTGTLERRWKLPSGATVLQQGSASATTCVPEAAPETASTAAAAAQDASEQQTFREWRQFTDGSGQT